MSEHRALVEWALDGREFAYEGYSRQHAWRFEGGIAVRARAAPENIPPAAPPANGVDPEQAFVAAVSSCHMLWFLHLACNRKWVVERYVDEAVGLLANNRIERVTLRPRVSFRDRVPSAEEHRALHAKAHEKCFIANSITSEVVVEPEVA